MNHGANVNASDSVFGTALDQAIEKQDMELITLLLDHGASVNLRSGPHGYTPLHRAVQQESISIIKLLLDHGARVDIEDIDKKKPVAHTRNNAIRKLLVDWAQSHPIESWLQYLQRIGTEGFQQIQKSQYLKKLQELVA